ncbi:MAG: DUF3089 domain-containing protein [Caulobacteraceae bacterium]
MFRIIAAALGGVLLFAAAAQAQPAAPDYGPNNYADKADWLCWPGRADACAGDLTATVVEADGSISTKTFKADPNAPIDCFYVYPTVSREKAMVSDMVVGPEEQAVVVQQAARLRAKCRLYAPMYRQVTLSGLQAALTRQPMAAAGPQPPPAIGYNDVKDAWDYYLAHENHGRGVVLVGHSQGSGVLTRLIANEIDGKPDQTRIVSAILMGTALVVPVGGDVGGAFKSIPLCHSPRQLGCAIAYSSFRETSPPPDNSRFGRPRNDNTPGMEAACVNPADLAGGTGAAKSYFGASLLADPGPQFQWVKGKTIATPFVSTPGLITATCVHTGVFHYVSIHINADPASPRASEIPGDVVVGGVILKDWGLHLIDANLFMGNLVDIVGEEAKAWAAKGAG